MAPCRYKGAVGGRGSAKSHFYAGQLVKRAILNPALRWACLRQVQHSLEQSVKRLIEDKIEAFGVGSYFRVLKSHIELPRGGIIIFQGMQNHTADSMRSLEGYDGAWFEEAHSASARSLELLTPTIRKDESELWFSWNRYDPDDPVDALFRENEGDDAFQCVSVTYRDNPFFPESLRLDMERDKRRDPDKYKHVWLGDYRANSEARIFHNWRVGEPEEFETDEDTRFYFGADWGFSIDPTVLIRCFAKGRTLYVDYEAYKIGCEIDDTPALFDQVPDAKRWTIRADSARPETISYLRRKGYVKIRAAVKGPGSVDEGIKFLQNYDIVVHPRCKHTIDELSFYSWKTDPHTDDILPIPADKKNHVIDALRYACEGLRRGKPFDPTVSI